MYINHDTMTQPIKNVKLDTNGWRLGRVKIIFMSNKLPSYQCTMLFYHNNKVHFSSSITFDLNFSVIKEY